MHKRGVLSVHLFTLSSPVYEKRTKEEKRFYLMPITINCILPNWPFSLTRKKCKIIFKNIAIKQSEKMFVGNHSMLLTLINIVKFIIPFFVCCFSLLPIFSFTRSKAALTALKIFKRIYSCWIYISYQIVAAIFSQYRKFKFFFISK